MYKDIPILLFLALSKNSTWNNLGNTNLILLAKDRNNHTSKMKELLENGADVNATNNYGETAVYLVIQFISS